MKTKALLIVLIFSIALNLIKSDDTDCVANGCNCSINKNDTNTQDDTNKCTDSLSNCFSSFSTCSYNKKSKQCEWKFNSDLVKCLNPNNYCVKSGCDLERCVRFDQSTNNPDCGPFSAKRACYQYANCNVQSDGTCQYAKSGFLQDCLDTC